MILASQNGRLKVFQVGPEKLKLISSGFDAFSRSQIDFDMGYFIFEKTFSVFMYDFCTKFAGAVQGLVVSFEPTTYKQVSVHTDSLETSVLFIAF